MTLDGNTLIPIGLVTTGLMALMPMLLKTMRAAVRIELQQAQQARQIEAIHEDLAQIKTRLHARRREDRD